MVHAFFASFSPLKSLSAARSTLLGALCLLGIVSASTDVSAQRLEGRTYIVGRGETLGEIAQILHVSVRDLAEANHLHDPYILRHDRRLRLPSSISEDTVRALGGTPLPANAAASQSGNSRNGSNSTSANANARNGSNGRNSASTGTGGTGSNTRSNARPGTPPRGRNRWGTPAAPGFVRLVRESTGDQQSVSLRRVGPRVLSVMRSFLHSNNGNTHAIHPELLRKLARVSDHFGGRRIHVISGYRPFRRGQWTPHSNHNSGRAMDFRVEGVPNRLLRDFCRTIPMTGCGYYPRSVFVHMDVRTESAYWVDWSRPGQRPIYGREDRPPEARPQTHVQATAPHHGGEDEGVDDVAQDNPRVREATAVEEHDDDSRARQEDPTEGSTATPSGGGSGSGSGSGGGSGGGGGSGSGTGGSGSSGSGGSGSGGSAPRGSGGAGPGTGASPLAP